MKLSFLHCIFCIFFIFSCATGTSETNKISSATEEKSEDAFLNTDDFQDAEPNPKIAIILQNSVVSNIKNNDEILDELKDGNEHKNLDESEKAVSSAVKENAAARLLSEKKPNADSKNNQSKSSSKKNDDVKKQKTSDRAKSVSSEDKKESSQKVIDVESISSHIKTEEKLPTSKASQPKAKTSSKKDLPSSEKVISSKPLPKENESDRTASSSKKSENVQTEKNSDGANPLGSKINYGVQGQSAMPSLDLISIGVCNDRELVSFFVNNSSALHIEQAKRLARLYIAECSIEGVNSDIAFVQMCLETGFLNYGNLVEPYMNNFCGLGAIDSNHKGHIFETEQMGVRAHVQHLKAYGCKERPLLEIVDPRYAYVNPKGKAPTIKELSGTWAADKEYGKKLYNLLLKLSYEKMK